MMHHWQRRSRRKTELAGCTVLERRRVMRLYSLVAMLQMFQ